MKKEYEKYILSAKAIDVDFQRALYTKCSFIEEFESLSIHKLIMRGCDLFGNDLMDLYDYYKVVKYSYSNYSRLLEQFSEEQGINVYQAHDFILKQFKLYYPNLYYTNTRRK